MDKRTTNRYRMLLSAQEVLNAHDELWTDHFAMQQAKSQLDNLLEQVRQNLDSELPDGKLATANKKILKRRLADELTKVKGVLRLHAAQQNDKALVQKLRLNPTGRMGRREIDFLTYSSEILERATAKQTDLENYGLTADMLNQAAQLHSMYHSTITLNRVKRKAANRIKAENRALVAQAVNVLNEQIDEYVPLLTNLSPEFTGSYQRVRGIDDY
jgi:hypothetical protein